MSEREHHRVSEAGKQMGRVSAKLTVLGRARLDAAGLGGLDAPGSRGEMCATCACRPGGVPNGCLQTQLDFLKCVVEGVPFLCHAPKDGRLCAGWVGARAEVVARPLPQGLVDEIARWEFSPPDDVAPPA